MVKIGERGLCIRTAIQLDEDIEQIGKRQKRLSQQGELKNLQQTVVFMIAIMDELINIWLGIEASICENECILGDILFYL